jgi:hypothetical protein
VLALVLWSLLATDVGGQVRVVRSGDDRLSGVDQVDVLVVLESAQAQCETSVPSMRAQAVDALRAAGITATTSEKARSWHYSIVVTVRTETAAATCASAILSELVAEVAAVPEADKALPPAHWGSWLMGIMPLVRESALVIASPVAHDAAVQQAVRTHAAAIASRIRRANQD